MALAKASMSALLIVYFRCLKPRQQSQITIQNAAKKRVILIWTTRGCLHSQPLKLEPNDNGFKGLAVTTRSDCDSRAPIMHQQ
jgi:hypothetical protein